MFSSDIFLVRFKLFCEWFFLMFRGEFFGYEGIVREIKMCDVLYEVGRSYTEG